MYLRAGVQQLVGRRREGPALWALPTAQQELLTTAAKMLDLLFVCVVNVQCAVMAPSRADLRMTTGRSELLSQEQFM